MIEDLEIGRRRENQGTNQEMEVQMEIMYLCITWS